MKVVIVGANGFIGQAMVRYIRQTHPEVELVGVVRTPEMVDADALFRAVDQIESADLLIYLAGRGGIPESFDDPVDAFESACREACGAIDTARRRGIGTFVLASTCAVYPHGPQSGHEDGPLALRSPYAKAKRAAEVYGLTASELTGQDVRVVRLANIFGPGQGRQMIYDVAARAKRSGTVSLQSRGTEKRDFLHVDDTAQAIWTVATQSEKGSIVNIGSGQPRRVRDVAGLICASFGATLEISDKGPEVADGSGDAYPDVDALFKLGFEPRIAFEDGLEQTLDWIRSLT